MQRDILFFVRGLPEDRLVQGAGSFFMAPIKEPLHTQFFEGTAPVPMLQSFFGKIPGVVAVGFRNDYPEDKTAVNRAWKSLEGIFDGLALVVDGQQPQVCQVIKIREENSQGAKLMRYTAEMWIHLHRTGSDSPQKWKASRDELFKRLLRFFDMVTGGDPKYKNELGYQIAISAKMFRCGNESKSFGIEYLCKFSALEGLVCGSIETGKQKLLKARLAPLFRGSRRDIEQEVRRLWLLRCEASHQAKAFYDETMPDSKAPQCEIVTLEALFTGALVFALDHLGEATTVEDLWAKVSTYILSEYARMERPGDMQKLPLLDFLIDTKLNWAQAGALIDATHEAVRIREPNASTTGRGKEAA